MTPAHELRDAGVAHAGEEELSADVEQYREAIVEGVFSDALDLCRRLLRAESNPQRVESAHLVLDRLRGNKSDAEDDVNALLRLLANYVSPTRELTEDVLSLLFFCDHRVLVIHHLSKLTYQSKECVKLVVEAYLELLSSDRSLLVPLLGSLADLPLDAADKSAVLDATECLLDAAVEEDVPAVVQSLLSMVTAATAPRIAAKVRAECDRVDSGTLCLTLEVIGRFAVIGSPTLGVFLSAIRHADALTPFDIILLTHLMGKSTENEIAIKTSSFLAHRGRFQKAVMHETLSKLVQQEWRHLLPSFIRFCSFLLAVCFQDRTSTSLALRFIQIAVDCLGFLIENRTAVHEEALMLLFTLSSQPRKLLMVATTRSAQRSRGFLCWKIAEAVAMRLAELASNKSKVLAPYAHLFLDHLHSIASATNDSGGALHTGDAGIGNYPSHVIDILCCTMVTLTKQEHGVFSLLMITIQKQLVSRVGVSGIAQGLQTLLLRNQSSSSRTSAVAHVKQLMALFLAGHLLKSQITLEERDRKSLVSWILRLLSTAANEETLLHAMKLVRDGMVDSSSSPPFMKAVMSEEERSLCSSVVSQVFRKKSLVVSNRDEIVARKHDSSDEVLAFDDTDSRNCDGSAEATSPPLVVNLIEFTRRMQADLNTVCKSVSVDGEKDGRSALREDAVERECLAKLNVLRELYHSCVAFSPPKLQDGILDGGFLFSSVYRDLLAGGDVASDLDPKVLGSLIWSLVCGLDVAVASANEIASQLVCATNEKRATTISYQARLSRRLQICLELREQLERAIVLQKAILQVQKEDKLKEASGGSARQSELDEIEWLRCQYAVAERLVNGQSNRAVGDSLSASLYGVELRALCLFFEIRWKKRSEDALSLAHEQELLRVLSYHLRPDANDHQAQPPANERDVTTQNASGVSDVKRVLLMSSEGRRTLKYLSAHAGELSRLVNASGDDTDAGSESDEELEGSVDSRKGAVKELATSNLLCIYSLFIQTLERCGEPGDSTWTSGGTWNGEVMELFAAGCNHDESVAAADASDTRVHLEVFFQFLLHECLKMKDPQLACTLIDIIVLLTMRTRKQRILSHLCMMLLRQPFPLCSRSVLSLRDVDATRVPCEGLPVQSLPHAVVSVRGARQCSLAKYRCTSQKWRHLVYFAVGSWAFASSASSRSAVLGFYLNAMRALVESMVSNGSMDRKLTEPRSNSESESGDYDEEMEEFPAVMDGEHLSLTSLSVTTFSFFFDSVMLCSIASLSSVSPKICRGTGVGNMERESGIGPFGDICETFTVTHNVLTLYVKAEAAGFDLPAKTNLLVLRGASHMLKLVKHTLQKCVSWRAEQVGNVEWGALHHLKALFDASQYVIIAMDRVLGSFQERVALKMQQNGRLISQEKTSVSLGKGRWKHTLLAKTYGKKLRKRRWISKSESKLLPYFVHGVEELKDFVDHQSNVNNLELAELSSEESDNNSWLPLRSSTDTDLFARSGSVIEDELLNGSVADWTPDLAWDWNDDDEDEDGGSGFDEEDESDDEAENTLEDIEEAIRMDNVTHTPQVRRKAKPDDSSARHKKQKHNLDA
ncbi:hypothetical protein Gpo141_00001436 [Globisporangium polare]